MSVNASILYKNQDKVILNEKRPKMYYDFSHSNVEFINLFRGTEIHLQNNIISYTRMRVLQTETFSIDSIDV